MENIAAEMKATLKQFNKGVQDVTVEYGIFCIFVSSKRALHGVKLDLMRSRAFRSVSSTDNAFSGKGFIVHAIPA